MNAIVWSLTAVYGLTLASDGLPNSNSVQQADPLNTLHTMAARKLLHDDPDLAECNIGVIVENRVATLWGPVPSGEAAFRAELRLKSMVGLAEVRNELFVSELVVPVKSRPQPESPPTHLPELLVPQLPMAPRYEYRVLPDPIARLRDSAGISAAARIPSN